MDGCVFCGIVAGTVPGDVVMGDEVFLAIRDVDPKAETHLLVLPREHHENLDTWLAAGGSGDALLAFVRQAAGAVDIDGRYRLVTNVGEAAGQVVPHLHVHLMAGTSLPGF